MSLKDFMSRLTDDRIYGKAAAGLTAAIMLTTGVAAVTNKGPQVDCPCNGTCECHYQLQADLPSDGVGRTTTITRTDIGCPDWNLNTAVYGWDGRMMEQWEFDLFARIFYLEFWGSCDVLCEAGCDAMLRLWETEEFGKKMGELLTARNAAGTYVYETYGYVWDVKYDTEGLKWCRDFCMDRFVNGPTWSATYFQKYNYPDWGEWTPTPCYEIEGIYFSVASH